MRKENRIKQFRLPIEEALLERVINDSNCFVIDKQIALSRDGDFIVYLEYEKFFPEGENEDSEFEDTDIIFG